MNTSRYGRMLVLGSALLFSLNAFAIYPDPDPEPEPDPDPCTTCDGYVRGPDPTTSSLERSSGPYSVRTISVSSSVSGFGGGTIHYPTGTTGTMGVIAVVPGFVSSESSIRWWGPRIASHGFVVITIDTNSGFDSPDSRASQLRSALSYAISQSNSSRSSIYGMIDSNRRAVMGWSMGGGGALKAAADDRSISAALPQAPYYSGRHNFSSITSPTMIIACENDSTASVSSHASPFYNAIPSSTDKAFLEINNGSHSCANSGNSNSDILGKYGVSWMKRFVDHDTRYNQFLCGPNHTAPYAISEYRDTCAY